jgi:NAD(P)-dependent dehydrogenase (short-subunit alcohol dehydrogenase family)
LRVVLITGASAGIGAAAARELAASGLEAYGTSRRSEAIAVDAPAIRWIAMDVHDERSVQAGVDEVLKQAGRLDGLVCNALRTRSAIWRPQRD